MIRQPVGYVGHIYEKYERAYYESSQRSRNPEEYLESIYKTYRDEVRRKEESGGKIIVPKPTLAFFGQYKLKNVPSPSLEQMLEAYQASREAGLQNVRVGNLGVLLKSQKDYEIYKSYIH